MGMTDRKSSCTGPATERKKHIFFFGKVCDSWIECKLKTTKSIKNVDMARFFLQIVANILSALDPHEAKIS